MANSTITFYPVGNGSMAFITINDTDKSTLLIDMHIRTKSEIDSEKDYYDVMEHLRKKLKKNQDGYPYISSPLT